MNRRFAIGIALLFHLSLALAQTSGEACRQLPALLPLVAERLIH